MSFLKTLLSISTKVLSEVLFKIYKEKQKQERAEEKGKDELRLEQKKAELRDAKRAEALEDEVSRSDDDDLNEWLRHPDERE